MLVSRGNVAAVTVKGVEAGNKIFKQKIQSAAGGDAQRLVFADETTLPGIIIGIDTASTLGVTVGETINVIPPIFSISPFGMMPKMKSFRVVGVFGSAAVLWILTLPTSICGRRKDCWRLATR